MHFNVVGLLMIDTDGEMISYGEDRLHAEIDKECGKRGIPEGKDWGWY